MPIAEPKKKEDQTQQLLSEIRKNLMVKRLEKMAKWAEVERQAGHGIR